MSLSHNALRGITISLTLLGFIMKCYGFYFDNAYGGILPKSGPVPVSDDVPSGYSFECVLQVIPTWVNRYQHQTYVLL